MNANSEPSDLHLPDKSNSSSPAPGDHGRGLLSIEWWPIERPIPYARNPRFAPEAAIAKVAASLAEYGWRQPIVVDADDVIVVGHTRLLAAKRLGLAQVPVHIATDLTPQQVKAYRLADNRTAEESSWDLELLPLEISELADLSYDLSLPGFNPDELAKLGYIGTEGLTDPDEVPEVPEEPITKPGELIILGNHRLLCGDATDPVQVKRLMAGQRAALMATDPPYLVNYDGGNHPQTWGNGGKQAGRDVATKHWDSYTDHASAVDFYQKFLAAALAEALCGRPLLYQWFGMMRIEIVLAAWRANGLLPHQVIIWHKSRSVLGRSDFMYDYEPCLYGWIEGQRPAAELRPPAEASAVWEVASSIEDGAAGIHPTQKPVELIRRPIIWHTSPGELIYEPFSGSGTAIIAAEMTGRRCNALELSPAFVDCAIERWQRFTGKTAVRDG
jgi:DNA modification methylase